MSFWISYLFMETLSQCLFPSPKVDLCPLLNIMFLFSFFWLVKFTCGLTFIHTILCITLNIYELSTLDKRYTTNKRYFNRLAKDKIHCLSIKIFWTQNIPAFLFCWMQDKFCREFCLHILWRSLQEDSFQIYTKLCMGVYFVSLSKERT